MGQEPFCGRFAPTPSGALHLGNLRTALAAYCHARKNNGQFFLRFDDLDAPRVKPGKIAEHQQDLAALGLVFDGPVLFQSQRVSRYLEALEQLKNQHAVYLCFCTRREIQQANSQHQNAAQAEPDLNTYPGTCRSLSREEVQSRLKRGDHHCWRFRLFQDVEPIEDAVMGTQQINLQQQGGDFVVVRADGQLSYQLACAVDDAQPGITHVLRGADLLTSAARQQRLMKTLGLNPPKYGHLPLMQAPGGRKLSKSDGDDDLRAYAKRGINVCNIVSMLAASLGLVERGEAISLEKCIEQFPTDLTTLKDLYPPT